MSSNTTSKVITTKAGEALIAQMQAENKVLVIDKFIFANVPNRPDFPQREDVLPTEHVVHESAVHEQGRMTENSVIYSTTLASNVGPFTFNWSGLYCSEHNTLVAINFPAAIGKTVDGSGVTGNTLVRSFVLEYKGIAETTNITVDPASWQYDAHKRMSKMDNDSAQAIIDQKGKDWFIDDGFIVTHQSTAYNIKAGAGYVSGHRITLDFDRIVQAPIKPSFIYVDAYREGSPTGEWVTKFNFVVSPDEKDDYTDAQGVQHFMSKIAQVMEDGSVINLCKRDIDNSGYINTTIFHDGFNSTLSKCRIPAITTDKYGTVYAFCDQRSGWTDAPNHINIGMRKSTDNGATWSDTKIVMNRGEHPNQGVSDPCVIYDSTRNTIFCFAVSLDKTISDPTTTLSMYMSKSSDMGETWTSPELINYVNDTHYKGLLQGPGNAVEKNGVLYLPVQYWHPTDDGARSVSGVIKSIDGGSTWTSMGHVTENTSENAIAFFNDDLIMVAKSEDKFGRITYRYDFETEMWGAPQWGEDIVNTQGSLITVQDNNYHALLRCQNENMGAGMDRRLLTISASYNGHNYKKIVLVKNKRGMGYSSLAYSNGYLHVLYEDETGVAYSRYDLGVMLSRMNNDNSIATTIIKSTHQIENGIINIHPDITNVFIDVEGADISAIIRSGDLETLDISFNRKCTILCSSKNKYAIADTIADDYKHIFTPSSKLSVRLNSRYQWLKFSFSPGLSPLIELNSDAIDISKPLNLSVVGMYGNAKIAVKGKSCCKVNFIKSSNIISDGALDLWMDNSSEGAIVFESDKYQYNGYRGARIALIKNTKVTITNYSAEFFQFSNVPVIPSVNYRNNSDDLAFYDFDEETCTLTVSDNVSSLFFLRQKTALPIKFINSSYCRDQLSLIAFGAGSAQQFVNMTPDGLPSGIGVSKIFFKNSSNGDIKTMAEGDVFVVNALNTENAGIPRLINAI